MKAFFKSLVSDETGMYSSKRVAGLLSIICLNFSLIITTIYPKSFHPSDSLVNSIALFALGSFGLTSLDKYFKNKKE